MLSIAILDDERLVLDEYEKLIPMWLKSNGIKGKIEIATTDPEAFIEEIREQTINVCIIDMNLKSSVSGIEIAKQIREEKINTEIIFSTGMDDYMKDAFNVQPYNYILKPIDGKLEKCLVKLAKEIESMGLFRKTIDIKFGSDIFYIPIDEIQHIQRMGMKTIIQTVNRRLEVYDSLEVMLERLNDNRFKQCHRAIIVNQDHIDFLHIENKHSRFLVLHDTTKLEVGGKYYQNFKSNEEWGNCYAV